MPKRNSLPLRPRWAGFIGLGRLSRRRNGVISRLVGADLCRSWHMSLDLPVRILCRVLGVCRNIIDLECFKRTSKYLIPNMPLNSRIAQP